MKIDAFWPSKPESFLAGVLGRFGFGIQATKNANLNLARENTAGLSVWFPPPSSNADAAIAYRISLDADGRGENGDLAWDMAGKGGFRFRLPGEVGGWLQTGSATLHADCVLDWSIGENIWTHDLDREWMPSLTLRLHWQHTFETQTLGGEAPTLSIDKLPIYDGALSAGVYAMRRARDALKSVEAGQPQSFFPELTVVAKQDARFGLYAPPISVSTDAKGFAVWGFGPTPLSRPPLRLSLAHSANLIPSEAQNNRPLRLKAELPSLFVQTPGTPLELALDHDADWVPTTSDAIEAGEPYFASFRTYLVSAAKTTTWRGRLSSLEFEAEDLLWPKEAIDRQVLRTGGRGRTNGMSGISAWPGDATQGFAAYIDLSLPLTSVVPAGVELARNDRSDRAASLLIRVEDDPIQLISDRPPFWLRAREEVSPRQDRRLDVTVTENSAEGGEQAFVVLGAEPFSVLRVSNRRLGARGNEGNAIVATYSSDNRIWEFKTVAEHYRYLFPPQAVGESTDKPRRLHLHDLAPGVDAKASLQRPFEDEVAGDLTGLRRRAVEFRLTPSAELWIRPSDVERGYFMPEWESHEIFRQRGALGLGAALVALRGEFLYGLTVGVDVSKERTSARQARVAEIEALTGTVVGRTSSSAPFADRWNVLSRAIARRPERLELWATAPDAVVDFAPARFSDGVSYALRGTALHRAPLSVLESAEQYAQEPIAGGAGSPRYHPQGLSGGALWPVESANLFRQLVEHPQSEGGAIEQITLTPLGGDATQKAVFLGGKVAILSETRNGFVERQKVEVIGRIGALWHRAKHVVIYERTVNPSAQFAPTRRDDPQRTRTRRPVLRKVREYIELLEPERAYPDFSQAFPRSAGFLERVRFNSKIINVDSAWSRDVGDFGWEIPLWNRLAARERPQVYAMPDVAFCSAAEGDGERPVVAQECRDPDHLYFFADFKTSGADTDQWPPRLAIDYVNLPRAKVIAAEVDRRSAADPAETDGAQQRRPNVSRFLPGMRRFTWRLAPAAQKVAINAGRAGNPLYVGVDSVTFMRATHDQGITELPNDLKTAIDASAGLSPAPPSTAGLGFWASNGTGFGPEASAFSAAINSLASVIKPEATEPQITSAQDALKTAWTALQPKLSGDLTQGANDAKNTFKGFAGTKPAIAKGKQACEELKSDAIGVIQRKSMLAEAHLRDWQAESDRILETAENLPDMTAGVEALVKEVRLAVAPVFTEASDDIASAGQGVETARAIVADAGEEVAAATDRAQERVHKFAACYERDKPWSPDRYNSFTAGLLASASSIAGDAEAAIAEARQRLSAELSNLAQKTGGHLAKALEEVTKAGLGPLVGVQSFQGAVGHLLRLARSGVEGLAGTVLDEALAKLADARAKLIAAAIPEDLRARLLALLDDVDAAVAGTRATLAEISTAISGIEALTGAAAGTLKQAIGTLTNSLTTLLRDLANIETALTALAEEMTEAALADAQQLVASIPPLLEAPTDMLDKWLGQKLSAIGDPVDLVVRAVTESLDAYANAARVAFVDVQSRIDGFFGEAADALAAVQAVLKPEALLDTVLLPQVVRPLLAELLKGLPDSLVDKDWRPEIRARLENLTGRVGHGMRGLTETALGTVEDVSAVCEQLFEGLDGAYDYINALATQGSAYIDAKIAEYQTLILAQIAPVFADGTLRNVGELLASVGVIDRSVRGLHNDLSRSYETASAYGDRVFDAIGKLDHGTVMAAPSNILKLYSAVTSAPEIAALKADIDRIRASFDELSDIIDTTKANALFDGLGDELKALGLSLPFDGIGDRLLPADLTNLDIGRVFRSFGGAKLDRLFSGYKLPAGVRDAVRVTHDFDKKQARAWVQIDIDAPMPGRRSLFSLGIMKADFVDMRLTGKVRLEASKDSEKVTQTGFGRMATTLDMVVSGQSMVKFEKFALNFSKEGGLDIEFDPKNIRLNSSFKFIQDFLSTLFPDELGGMKVINQGGIPVGVEHEFCIPPISLNFATSGVSNIAISNRFQLTAYPNFILANRFSLSRPERPFIFSIFILGGTGYIQVDAEYRPFESQLMVVVEAAAGASAALAFAFGPFSGQVFITLSMTLTYRKLLGEGGGGGLSIGALLVIAGYIDVAGIVTVGIYLMLRMTYQDSGQIDAEGTLSVTIRISRFFKITARAGVKYKLRGGQSETTTSGGVSVSPGAKMAVAPPLAARSILKLQNARR